MSNIFGEEGSIDEFRYGFLYGDPLKRLMVGLGSLLNPKVQSQKRQIEETHAQQWQRNRELLEPAGYKWNQDARHWANPKAPGGLSVILEWEDPQEKLRAYAHRHPEFNLPGFLGEAPSTVMAGVK